MVGKIKCILSIILLVVFKIRPKREYVQRIGKALSTREFVWAYEVFLDYLEKDLLLYSRNDAITTDFLNKGNGQGTIQSYRKIEFENISLFEKIYFRDRSEWKKTVEFYDSVFQSALNAGIVAPKLLHTSEGEDLIVAYTEYLDLKPIKKSEYFGKAIEMAARLANISYQYKNTVFPEILNYNSDIHFKHFKSNLVNYMDMDNNGSINALLSDVEQYIQQQLERCICHGDLCNNLFKNNKLIDWDRFGYYPIGYEFAMILIHVHQRDGLTIDTYLTLEKKMYSVVSNLVSDTNFKMSLSYFALVFLHYQPSGTVELRHALTSIIKERYSDLSK